MLDVTRIIFPRRGSPAPAADMESHAVQTIVAWLERDAAGDAAEYHPSFDLLETPTTIEIVADLPGVAPEAVRVMLNGDTVIITGEKRPTGCRHADAFHLAERTFGRFACAVRVDGAVDASNARARLHAGELHIALPRIAERRRRDLPIAVERA